jgi:hypothetical protein
VAWYLYFQKENKMIEKGMFFTLDKKKLLTDEVQSELNKLTEDIRNKGLGGDSDNKLQQSKKKLQEIINLLNGKKGVITPQETDDILTAIDESKRLRLESQFYFGLKKSTFYLVIFAAVGVGTYIYLKKKA